MLASCWQKCGLLWYTELVYVRLDTTVAFDLSSHHTLLGLQSYPGSALRFAIWISLSPTLALAIAYHQQFCTYFSAFCKSCCKLTPRMSDLVLGLQCKLAPMTRNVWCPLCCLFGLRCFVILATGTVLLFGIVTGKGQAIANADVCCFWSWSLRKREEHHVFSLI